MMLHDLYILLTRIPHYRGPGFYFWRYPMLSKLTPLKLARLERGFSQWDVAKATGIAQTLISLYEREFKEPSEEHKKTLAKLYNKRLEDLWK
jgi:DNA-binding XRE family transcriptional regulator